MATFPEIHAAAFSPSASVRRAKIGPTTRILVAAVVVPLLPLLVWWIGTKSLLYQHGWFNLEYVGLLCIGILWPSWWTAALLTTEICIALIQPIARLYYFHSSDVLLSLRYLHLLPAHRLFEYGLVLFSCALVCAISLRWALGEERSPIAGKAVAVIFVCTGAAIASSFTFNGHALEPRWRESDERTGRILSVPLISLIDSVRSYGHDSQSGPGRVPLSSSLALAMRQLPQDAKPNIVLVLTESWGLAQDDRINRAEQQPYDDPRIGALYREITGAVPFDGATTSGETRALCGDAEGIASISEPASYFANCWPERMNHRGYRTVAVHGFTPTMYQRERWYSRFGFSDAVFQPQLQQSGAAMCDGAFPGICDASVAQWIGQHLISSAQDRPVFVHWVTLGSHLPVPPEAAPADLEACRQISIVDDNALCSWFNLVQKLHQSVAKLALMSISKPTVFIIVGDHAPPFLNAATRSRFSQTSVPYVILMPRVLDVKPDLRVLHAANEGGPSPVAMRKRRHHTEP